MRSISKAPEPEAYNQDNDLAPPTADEAAATAAGRFVKIQEDFVNTLDRIDKQLKRQIYALEEAGIITLRSASDQQPGADGEGGVGGRAKGITARLDPDGVGRYGSLDVGRLNMASSTAERDMESELWKRARGLLEAVTVERAVGGDRMQE
jgi:Mediator complex protein